MPHGSLYQLVDGLRDRCPGAIALLEPGRRELIYGQLAGQIDYVGTVMRGLGIRREDRVAVVLPNGSDMAAAFLGVAACAVCAPLNPSYRREQFEFYLTDLDAKAVIVPADSDCAARDVAKRLGLRIVELVACESGLAGSFSFAGAAEVDDGDVDWPTSDDVALVLHTSGTTSRPKLVPLSHRNLCESARNIGLVLGLSPADRCLNVMPLFHIHGLVGVLCSSIASGGSVVCTPGYADEGFAQWMSEFKPTWYSAVPTIHQSVLALARQIPQLAEAAPLRLIRSSSSSLPPTVMQELESVFRVPVIESYGMTEAAHQMASNPLPASSIVPAASGQGAHAACTTERKPGSVGLPAGPDMAIMDDEGNFLPAGQTGEIVIRGANVTTGYVNNPEANEAAFANGWFRTGDLGRVDHDGYFYITGRKKEMINRGGENVSPREIDEVLLEHSAVEQAVAFAVPHSTLGEDIAVAVVLSAEHAASESELRRFAFDRLPPVKAPTRILKVAAIPKGPTGKLQRIGLHKKLEDHLHVRHVAPRNDLEKSVVAVIEQVLETTDVGVTDNFFGLGGNSLKAVRVLGRLSSEYQVDLPPVALFLNPTAEELGLEITRRLGEASGLLEELLDEIEGMSDEEARRLAG